MKFYVAASVAALSLVTLAGIAAPTKHPSNWVKMDVIEYHPVVYYSALLSEHERRVHPIRVAISSRLNYDLHTGKGLHYPGYIPFRLSHVDIRGSWAHVEAQPLRYGTRLDRVLVLLHRRHGQWSVLQYGGGLSGKGVPSRLRKRWGLLPE